MELQEMVVDDQRKRRTRRKMRRKRSGIMEKRRGIGRYGRGNYRGLKEWKKKSRNMRRRNEDTLRKKKRGEEFRELHPLFL